jgi:hypothetical protein
MAQDDPDRVFAEFINLPLQPSCDVWNLTYHDFAAMVDQTAWWLDTFAKTAGWTRIRPLRTQVDLMFVITLCLLLR